MFAGLAYPSCGVGSSAGCVFEVKGEKKKEKKEMERAWERGKIDYGKFTRISLIVTVESI